MNVAQTLYCILYATDTHRILIGALTLRRIRSDCVYMLFLEFGFSPDHLFMKAWLRCDSVMLSLIITFIQRSLIHIKFEQKVFLHPFRSIFICPIRQRYEDAG